MLSFLGLPLTSISLITTPKIVAAPAKRQLSHGLVESHWRMMVHMAHAYLTETKNAVHLLVLVCYHPRRMSDECHPG
jgi:hypothetical protein